MAQPKPKKTTTITGIRTNVLEIADSVRDIYLDTKDMRAANIAIKGYNSAIAATIAEIQYKRATGKLKDVTFIS